MTWPCIRINRRLPSVNEHMWRSRWVYVEERNTWYTLIRVALVPLSPPETRPMRLSIVSHRVRLLDVGNLYGGSKMIPDGLKRLGYLVDDSPKWCDLTVTQVQCAKKDEHTTIEMEPR